MRDPLAFNEAAFPTPTHDGMTLRDYFAAKAMQARMQATITNESMLPRECEWAYKWADAMMEAREK